MTLTAQHLLQCTLAPLAPAGLCLLAEGELVWLQSPLKQQLAILMASSLLASLQHCSQSASYHLSLLSPCQGCPSTRVPAARGLEAAAHVRPLTSSSLRVSGRQEISFLRNLMALPMLAERGRHWFRKLQRRNGLSSRATRGQGQEEEGYSWAGDGGQGGRTQSPRKVSPNLGGHQPREVTDRPHSVELQLLCSSITSPHLMCGFSLATRSRDSSSLGGVE